MLLSSLDLFSIWTIALLASGSGIAARLGTRKALPVIAGLWLATVLVRAIFVA